MLLATANPDAGEVVLKKCVACHTAEKGGPNKVGPNLWGIVNRPVASHEGFAYSAAMKDFSEGGKVVWDYDHLNHFLTSPKGLVKGTAMGFAGVKKPDERANLIAYLRTLSDSPAPLPEAPAPRPKTHPPRPTPLRLRRPPNRLQRRPSRLRASTAPSLRRPSPRRLNDEIVIQNIMKKPGSARLFLLDTLHMPGEIATFAVSNRLYCSIYSGTLPVSRARK